jgi:hypothetical protein
MACSGVTLLLFLASINILLLRKWQGKRIHFPTLVFLFIIVIVDVTYFGIANRIHEVTLLESVHAEENDFSPGTPACTFRAVMSNVLSTLSILLNDVFFVSSSCVAQQVECTNRPTTDLPSVHTLWQESIGTSSPWVSILRPDWYVGLKSMHVRGMNSISM